MDELKQLLEDSLDEKLRMIVLSGVKDKSVSRKIQIRPVRVGKQLLFQAADYKEDKVFHYNYEKATMIEQITAWISRDFRQLQILAAGFQTSVLSSRKGKITIGKKKPLPSGNSVVATDDLAHDRKKAYILAEGQAIPFLVDLGVMTPEGRVKKGKYDKFRQINRFLEFIRDILPRLDKNKVLRIIDFGCGKSYLTFAMYYYLKEMNGYQVRMTGLDLKEDVIRHCNELAERYGYTELEFLNGDIATYEGADQVDMVVTLHACDTATDYALARAVSWGGAGDSVSAVLSA